MSHIRTARDFAWRWDESCQARDGKIVREQFFYDTYADRESEPKRTVARSVAREVADR